MSNFLGPPPLCGARTRAIVIVRALRRSLAIAIQTPLPSPAAVDVRRSLEHAGDPLLLQVLAHDPGDVPVVGLEPASHDAATLRGRRRDRDAPAVAERLAQRLELVRAPVRL